MARLVSIPGGIFRPVLEGCFLGEGFLGDVLGDAGLEYDVVEDGEVAPQPKKDPSFDPPGDFSGGVSLVLTFRSVDALDALE